MKKIDSFLFDEGGCLIIPAFIILGLLLVLAPR
jgi:hypothetical protein